jgi:uncharacterized protein
MTDYHEPLNELRPQDRDITRALTSLKEEIEAVNWYHQRVATCTDPELKRVLAHNRDEEIEHACMVLEWLRRNVDAWNEELKTYLFSEMPVTEIEEKPLEGNDLDHQAAPRGSGDIGIGSLKHIDRKGAK